MKHPGVAVLLTALAGWMNQQQLHVMDYLREENGTLKQLVRSGRLQLNDQQRRRLAAENRRILCRERLAGLLNYFYREAA